MWIISKLRYAPYYKCSGNTLIMYRHQSNPRKNNYSSDNECKMPLAAPASALAPLRCSICFFDFHFELIFPSIPRVKTSYGKLWPRLWRLYSPYEIIYTLREAPGQQRSVVSSSKRPKGCVDLLTTPQLRGVILLRLLKHDQQADKWINRWLRRWGFFKNTWIQYALRLAARS